MTACYVCGGYLYRGVRHRKCEPGYHRARLRPCSVCGGLSRGAKHRRCGVPILAGWNHCGYCGRPTKGTYHNACMPVGLGDFAIFRDMEQVVQRRCTRCHEWFPFAAVDGEGPAGTRDAWSPHGHAQSSGRRLYTSYCRACIAEVRRARNDGDDNRRMTA